MTRLSPDRGDLLIRGRNIGVRDGNAWRVRHVDISISRGEIVTLLGPNGSGKSTIAKVISGILAADEGEMERRPGLTLGYAPQKFNIDWTFPLTPRRLLCLTRPHSAGEIRDALEMVDAAHLLDAPVQHLSGGEFQRVSLARAMISTPDLLVLDEPVQGVDFAGQSALYQLIGKVRDNIGCGVLLISHDLHVVMAQTDKVVCLNGHVCCSGTPADMMNNRQFAEMFGPDPSHTLAIYHHQHDHAHGPDGTILAPDSSAAAKAAGKADSDAG